MVRSQKTVTSERLKSVTSHEKHLLQKTAVFDVYLLQLFFHQFYAPELSKTACYKCYRYLYPRGIDSIFYCGAYVDEKL